MYHELLFNIISTFHTKKMLQECSALKLPSLSKELLNLFLCARDNACIFYRNDCLNEKCL